jgi:hypothetical protein
MREITGFPTGSYETAASCASATASMADDAYSEYGHKPWQPGYKDKERDRIESAALERFKAEFSVMQGPAWRGTSAKFNQSAPHVATPEFHNRYPEKARKLREAQRKAK